MADKVSAMSSTGPSPKYDPLPLTNRDEQGDTISRDSGFQTPTFYTPQLEPLNLPSESPPPGAGQPRFIGAALYDDPQSHDPRLRYSITSSHNTSQIDSDYNSSVYALNAATPLTDGYTDGYRDDPGSSDLAGSKQASKDIDGLYLEGKRAAYTTPKSRSKRKVLIFGALAALALIILAVIIPLYFTVFKKKNNSSSGGSSGSSGSSAAHPTSTDSPKPVSAIVTGGDGSLITTDDGSTFTYSNSFGGYWYWDVEDPFNNGARAQSWTPALNETFNYGVDKIRGVNLGGWLNTEPFISPALYERYANNSPPVIDEWTLSQAMAADTANGGLGQLETHYKTFITEEDFAQIAGAGLNHVRIPLPYWAIEVRSGEPFLPKTAWTYFLKAIQWARKYGIRINLDLHALPGSQNGWNHSGRLGSINVLNGPMGLANAQRSLDYIRIIGEFISQPQYKDVVTIFGITNEPQESTIGMENLSRYYLQAYNTVRTASGIGQGQGPFISFHDGFLPRDQWSGFLPSADRISLDSHPYLCFGGQSAAPMSTYANTPCASWGSSMNDSMSAFGLTAAGEWSNAVTDCGLWVNGVGQGNRYEGTFSGGGASVGSCDVWTDWQNYDQPTKAAIEAFALASMDALQNWFFWTWKIGNSSVTGQVESPAWSYQLGLQEGWMPKDPRSSAGSCGNTDPWQGPLKPYQTGGAGAGSIPASISSSLAWPPTQISNAGAATLLPTYTPTGPIPTLPGPTFTNTQSATVTANVGDGWQNAADNTGLMVQIPTCSYLDPWIGPTASPPSPLCSNGARRDLGDVPQPLITLPAAA